ncbi:MaoC/PaaZ C-terminal domain-containing protein [Sphingobium fuliginis]|nr:MaoC/PaaZ C-terminal domain-containing protein [Sphingobium fuliginis]
MPVDAIPPSSGYFFDELFVGQRFMSHRVTVTEEAIIRFALEWDPHDFHLDRERAKSSIFGELVGSGLQTLLLTSRLLYDSSIFRGTALAGLGMDNLKFLKPLLPGDTIGACSEIILKSEGKRQDGGEVSLRIDTVNHRDEVIMTHVRHMLVSRSMQSV